MRKIHLLGLTLFAVFAFSAVAASAAFAENPVWLIGNNPVAAPVSVVTTGTLLVADLKVPLLGEAGALCTGGSFVGTVGPEGLDEITEVLNAAGEALGQGLAAPTFLCLGEGACAEVVDVEVKPVNLPWHTQLELNAAGQVVDHIFGAGAEKEPGWDVMKCLTSLGEQADLCEGLTFALIENLLSENGLENDLMANFVEGAPTIPVHCEVGGPESGDAVSEEGLISTLNGEIITVSGDGVTE